MAEKQSLHSTHQWLATVAEEFGVSPELARELVGDILDLTADVAHNGPSRPAAPTTAFLVGLAAGQDFEPGQDTADRAARVRELVTRTGELLKRYEKKEENADEQD